MQKISIKINTRVLCQSNDCATYMKSIYPDQAHKIDFLLNWQSFNAQSLNLKMAMKVKKLSMLEILGCAKHTFIHT